MPLCGGLAVAAGFAVSLLAGLALTDHGPDPRARPAARRRGRAITGVIDDRFGLNAWQKLIGQLIGRHRDRTRLPVPPTSRIPSRRVSWTCRSRPGRSPVLWIVGITNALNLLDGLDGPRGGRRAIIAATLAAISFQSDQPFVVLAALALAAALLGFLPHNFAPARIFLGDTGALFVGFTLSVLALACYRRVSMITMIVPMLALGVPILDTAMSILRRIVQHKPIFTADRQHMHHRLLAAEGSPRAAVIQFYMLTAAFCLIAVSFTRLQGLTTAVFLVTVLALTVRLLWNLGVIGRIDETAPSGSAEKGTS
jgi:UDP-GlcNAc:undecaprenyl-phosphate GlcNAc-1-phosphate transferase